MNRDYPQEDGQEMGRPVVAGRNDASGCVGARLPAWETFAVEDRRVLVRVLIHMARRQAAERSGSPLTERG